MKTSNVVYLILLISLALSISNCRDTEAIGMPNQPGETLDIPVDKLTTIQASAQRTGDPALGRDYLLNGDYVDSGIPLQIFLDVYANPAYDLERTGLNEGVDHRFNAFISDNGTELAAPNCFQCHASVLDNELIIGLGNIDADFTIDQSNTNNLVDILVGSTYGTNSLEYEAYEPFSQAAKATGPNIVTETVGANPADKIAALLAAHRDPVSLEWIDEDQLGVPSEVVPTDVPPWWHLKKKNSMFYTSVGRGDFARISMASSILTLKDTIKAREVDDQFADVIAYINSLEAPLYTSPLNNSLLDEGENLFLTHCSGCHGTYGDNESYPNILVDLDLIQTDSMLISANFGFPKFTEWYNDSWFGQEPNAAQLVSQKGYVAPPLDGLWATAPYLHNGSVPDVRSLLDSESRPDIWKKIPNEYNHENVGWSYEQLDNKIDKQTYDSSIPGYGNSGHTFGDHLNNNERNALLEYLKTI